MNGAVGGTGAGGGPGGSAGTDAASGGPRSLPLLATAPGAEAEVEDLRLPCVWGEELLTRRLPEAGGKREQAEAATFSVAAAFGLHLNV